MSEEASHFSHIGACYQEMSGMWAKQVTKDWEPIQQIMQEYKGLAESWQAVLGEYEKEKDSPLVQKNTYRIAIEAEAKFFKQELTTDMTNAGQV